MSAKRWIELFMVALLMVLAVLQVQAQQDYPDDCFPCPAWSHNRADFAGAMCRWTQVETQPGQFQDALEKCQPCLPPAPSPLPSPLRPPRVQEVVPGQDCGPWQDTGELWMGMVPLYQNSCDEYCVEGCDAP